MTRLIRFEDKRTPEEREAGQRRLKEWLARPDVQDLGREFRIRDPKVRPAPAEISRWEGEGGACHE